MNKGRKDKITDPSLMPSLVDEGHPKKKPGGPSAIHPSMLYPHAATGGGRFTTSI